VDRRAAEGESERLNSEHPDRDRFEWVAFADRGESWAVIKVLKRKRIDPLKATTEAVPRPPQPDYPSVGPLDNLPFG
jgi:hypothetical protein